MGHAGFGLPSIDSDGKRCLEHQQGGSNLEALVSLAILAIAAFIVVTVFRNLRAKHVVQAGQIGLLYRQEVFAEQLEPGVYKRFDPFKRERLVVIPTTPFALTGHQHDVISADQFAFRLTVTPLVTITDPRAFHEGTPPIAADLAQYQVGPEYRYSQLSPVLAAEVLKAAAAKTLEEFIAAPAESIAGVGDRLKDVLPGTTLDDLVVSALTLPPEVRKMFTEVERARREGLAGLERAKAEQASLRALANAARAMSGNPQLAQLRALQTMENAKGAKTFVLGNPPEDPAQKSPND